jgi:hypothetical protein
MVAGSHDTRGDRGRVGGRDPPAGRDQALCPWRRGCAEQGELLIPERVPSIFPPVRDRRVAAWLVVGEVTRAIVATIRSSAPVVGVARRAVDNGPD